MILVLNAGSSSLKYAVFGRPSTIPALASGLIERIGTSAVADHEAAFAEVLERLRAKQLLDGLHAVGHRVVHGGERFRTPTLVDAEVESAIEGLIPLAPLHNPANLLGIRLAKKFLRSSDDAELPHVAVFDTAFHATLPEHAFRYALPQAWYEEFGVRKYGFHGTSHAYVSSQAQQVLAKADKAHGRIITLHLGNGASAAAILDGRCIDTSMGMTPLAGLMMGTRPGDLDPGLAGYLRSRGLALEDFDVALNKQSGLRAIAGDNDMRELLRRRAEGDAAARLAIEMYVYRVRLMVGAYVAALGGLDALVFTAGVGEHASAIREEICAGLACFGVSLSGESAVAVLVIATLEEWAIAQAVELVLDRTSA